MGKDLEYRINDFRKRIMGKDLSEKCPIKFSEDGTIIDEGSLSDSDSARFFLKWFGKIMVPYFGDKIVIEKAKLESEINPENKVGLYVFTGGFIAAKYILLYTLLDKVF
ncbi:hypothetical protein COY26_01525 [Candidatus Woesearchaeota archaeon CG_4_10_14_0_2_um_filter_33_10]|nr:MAG: hypothetical protein COV14_00900 [Candidatus Woesearchaeota archaeon CG10_big_fil_rev_8_21_14_0_10_33_12]PIU72420.1 MAG: hypothetical protein COS79_02945 [Candidatus Woesearchaeota archaeon CG06_land_8_20_14_3_00_33_13]PIZ53555.1 MAG: hypothetical protein COY26_01525 [Candidatus Woesearchaeota archaeon CG_4_10_14_0_2_um_filter_33_10]